MDGMNDGGEAVCALRRWYCAGKAESLASPVDMEIVADALSLDGRWARITEGRSIFFDPGCLRVFETTGPEEAVWRYVILSFEGTPCAAMVTQLVRVSDAQLSVEQDRESGMAHVMKRLRNAGLGAMGRRVLVVGNLFAAGPYGLVLAPHAEAARVWAALPGIIETLRKGGADVPAADFVLVKDFETDAIGDERILGTQGYGRLHTEAAMTLRLRPDWKTIEDYLGDMRFKYRKALRLTMQRCESSGCAVKRLCAEEMLAAKERLYGLYRQVEARADTRFGLLRPGHLPELARALGRGRFRCSAIMLGGEIVGFSTLIMDGGDGIAHIVGFDYAANAHAPVYHRLLLTLVEDAIAMGCGTLHFGRTALEAKARLGATACPAHVYVRHRSPLLNGAARILLNSVPQRSAVERHVFREADKG